MPSASLGIWQTTRAASLDEIEAAHASVGGLARGRRYATQQINHAYLVLLSSQFQGFCRDLHYECVEALVQSISPQILQAVLRAELLRERKLKQGNANPGNIGSDFGRLGIAFWPTVLAVDARNQGRQRKLEEMNLWRNAVAHQDFDPSKLGSRTTLVLSDVNGWRAACDSLVQSFDKVMRDYLFSVTGKAPW